MRIKSVVAGLALAATTSALAQSINEIRVQQTGVDTQIYVEIAGTPGFDLSSYSYIVIGNDDFADPGSQNGYIESVVPLSGVIPASGFYVVAEPSYTLSTPDMYAFLGFETDNNKTHMLVQNCTASVGDVVDANQDGTIDTTFWSSIADSVALIAYTPQTGTFSDYVYSATKIGPDGGAFPSKVQKCPTSGVWQIGYADVSPANDTPGEANPTCATGFAHVILNEIRIDQQGADNDEYAELAGTPGTDLSDLTYIVIGDGTATTKSGVVECVIPLTGKTIPANGLFLITSKTTAGGGDGDGIAFGKAGDLQSTVLNFENSDHVTHMLVRGYTGPATVTTSGGPDLDTNDDGILDSTLWASVADSVGFVKFAATGPAKDGTAGEWTYQVTNEDGGLTPMVGPDGINLPAHIYRCSPQGSWKIGFFDPVAAGAGNLDTPGSVNPVCSSCGNAGSGSCFTVHADPGCDNAACCSTVCGLHPACCSTGWDTLCSDTAFSFCLQGGSPPAIQLSEMRFSDESTRTANLPLNQYLEITGTPNASLNGVTLVVLNDQDAAAIADPRGVVDTALKLDGLQLDSAGRFLIVENGFNIPGVTPNYNSGGGLVFDMNKTATVMLVWNFYGSYNQDLDTDNDGVLDVTPWVSIIDSVSLTDGTDVGAAYSATVIGPHNGRLPEHIYRCTPDGTWTMGPAAVTTGYDTPRDTNAACGLPMIYTCGDLDSGDCYTPHDNAHCFNLACCEAVCAVVASCCDTAWDQSCVDAAGTLTACGGGSPIAYLNEARIDQDGVDNDEYVEIKAPPGTDLSSLTFIVIGDGSDVTKSGVIECAIPLTGQTVPASGYFVITLKNDSGQDGIALGYPGDLQVPTLNLENTDNLTLMLVEGFSGALNDDLDTNDDGVLDATPWTSVVDAISIVGTVHAAPTGSSEDWWYAPRIGPSSEGLAWHIYRCVPIGYWWVGLRSITDPDTITDRPGEDNILCPNGNACFGDLDGSGEVDSGDVGFALLDFGPCPGCVTDLDGSGEVDSGDIGLILLSYGPCP